MPAPVLVVAAALLREGRVLAARRTRPAGKWEFPGGKCEPGENPVSALKRELLEELGVGIVVGAEVAPDRIWPISDHLVMRIWYARALGAPRCRGAHDVLAWLAPAQLSDLDWLPADAPIADRIAADTRKLGGLPGHRVGNGWLTSPGRPS